VILFHNPRALEYLLDAIASARSVDELARMRRLAHAHYSGVVLLALEADIHSRAHSLRNATPTSTPTSSSPSSTDHQDEHAVGG
jgi:hypothetical protein